MNEREFHDQKAAQIATELPSSKYSSIILDKQVKHIYSELYRGKIVLDVGCGNGRLIRYFAKHGARMAIGMDISDEYIKSSFKKDELRVYNEKIKVDEKRNVFFIHSNVENIPLKDNSIETIVAFALVHHIAEKSNFFSECRRVLINGGYLIIVDPNGGHILRSLMNRFGRRVGFLTETEDAIKIDKLSHLLKNSRFSIQQLKFESFFGDISAHLSFIIFKKNPYLGRMIQCLAPLSLMLDALLDASFFKIFPSLGWRYFLLSRKESS